LTFKGGTTVGITIAVIMGMRWGENGLVLITGVCVEFKVKLVLRGICWDV